MTDHPIIFSAPMVQALLAGRKTQTRRLAWGAPIVAYGRNWRRIETRGYHLVPGPDETLAFPPSPWRKVQPGDRLWVREAWALPSNWTGPASRIAASCQEAGYKRPWAPIHYPADGTRDNWGHWREHEPGKPRSPIHMPRWASRLTLTVTDVRVQRLQEISEDDARSEGATRRPACNGFMSRYDGWCMDWSRVGEMSRWGRRTHDSPPTVPLSESDISLSSPSMAFASYWNEIHGPGAWDANPDVVALSFIVENRNVDA